MSYQGMRFISSSSSGRVGVGLSTIVGPTGPPGAFGGPQGLAGAQGGIGLQGSQGIIGLQGLQGLAGSTGVNGTQGLQGLQGLVGSTGVNGTQGYQGLMGSTGTAGTNGLQGYQGGAGMGFVVFANTNSYTGLNSIVATGGNIGQFVLVLGGQLYVYAGTGSGYTGPNNSYGYAGDVTDESKLIGMQGAIGYQGLQGLQGLAGSTGINGNQGNQGLQGLAGSTGVNGNQGSQGNQGLQGLAGSTGINGSQGNQGLIGATGNAGINGNQGFQGLAGSTGVNGTQGLAGAQGLIGATGPSNPGVQGIQGVTGSIGLQGALGLQGLPGVSIGSLANVKLSYTRTTDSPSVSNAGVRLYVFSGATGGVFNTPSSNITFNSSNGRFTVSEQGDYYLDARLIVKGQNNPDFITTDVYVNSNTGPIYSYTHVAYGIVSPVSFPIAFYTPLNINDYIHIACFSTGTAGPINVKAGTTMNMFRLTNGPTGTVGSQGNQGLAGSTGAGFQGYQGPTGPSNPGVQGNDGTQGYQGSTGPSGVDGINGFQGFQGYQGIQGSTGTIGYQGPTGAIGYQGLQGYQGINGYTSGKLYYLNYSITGSTGGYSQLSPFASPSSTGYTVSITLPSAGQTGTLANFITDINDPNVLFIPPGIWNSTCFLSAISGGGTPSLTDIQTYIQFFKYTSTGSLVFLEQSSVQPVTTTSASPYQLSAQFLQTPLSLDDRIVMKIICNNTTSPSKSITLSGYFQDSTYSNVITSFSTLQSFTGPMGPTGSLGLQGPQGSQYTGPFTQLTVSNGVILNSANCSRKYYSAVVNYTGTNAPLNIQLTFSPYAFKANVSVFLQNRNIVNDLSTYTNSFVGGTYDGSTPSNNIINYGSVISNNPTNPTYSFTGANLTTTPTVANISSSQNILTSDVVTYSINAEVIKGSLLSINDGVINTIFNY